MTDNMEVTTADMLEIWIGGGNGSEYVDGVGLCETAAKELRELHVEITRLRAENERLHKGLTNLIAACDAGRLVEHGAGGMTLQSQMMGSTINRVSAWAVELARAALEGDSE